MSTAIESVHLTAMQHLVLEQATEASEIFVSRNRKVAALALEGKGLGHVSDKVDGCFYFTINAAGRDQLRIRQ
jgi:hypothetical protein